MDIKVLTQRCLNMKLKALEMAASVDKFGAHVGGAFSLMEILASLYEIANLSDKTAEDRDRIILSKGHGALALYTALWQKGFVTEEDLATFDKNGTEFYAHPHRNLEKAIEYSGGSLGLGISYGVGVAKACKNKGLNNKIYIILGDGECDEGLVWEALMSIAAFKLDNVVVIVDENQYQLDGPTSEILNQFSLEGKFKAFGFNTTSVGGHSIEELMNCLTEEVQGPRAIIAKTVKANGISFLENNKTSHQCVLSAKKYDQAVNDIKLKYNESEC